MPCGSATQVRRCGLIQLANEDKELKTMLAGVINRQFKLINVDPFANAFNDGPIPDGHWKTDLTDMNDEVHERKWEIDSLCYPLRLAYHYWKTTGDTSIFDAEWIKAIQNILTTFRDQQRRDGRGSYHFQRVTERALDTMTNDGWGNPVKPVGLIASSFRPSDDATTFQFLIPSNFFAVSSLRKAAEILTEVNNRPELAKECTDLAGEVETALRKYATYNHPKYGTIYAFEVDGFGNHLLMDDANVPSLIALPYLGDVDINDPIYQNTRRFGGAGGNHTSSKGRRAKGLGGPAGVGGENPSKAKTEEIKTGGRMWGKKKPEPALRTSLSKKTIPPSSPAPGLHGKTHCLANSF